MKKITTRLLLLSLLLTQCAQPEPEKAPELPRTLTILVNDVSESAAKIHCPISELRKVWLRDALRGGADLATVLLSSESECYIPEWMETVRLDTLPHEGSIYRRRARAQGNERHIARAHAQLDRWDAWLSDSVFLPKRAAYSDVQRALELSQQLAENGSKNGFRIRLIVLSDLIHDMPDRSKLRPIELPAGTELILIGAAPSMPTSTIFPGAHLIESPIFKHELVLPPI